MLESYLEKYIEACKIHGSGFNGCDDYKTVNKAHATLMENFKALINDENGREMLKSLLNHEDVYVSAWTASLMIFDYPKECKKIIKRVAKGKGIWAGSMRTFYEEWKKGNLKRMY